MDKAIDVQGTWAASLKTVSERILDLFQQVVRNTNLNKVNLSNFALFVLTSPTLIPSHPLNTSTLFTQLPCWATPSLTDKWSSIRRCRLGSLGWTLELPGRTKSLWSSRVVWSQASLHIASYADTRSSRVVMTTQQTNQDDEWTRA